MISIVHAKSLSDYHDGKIDLIEHPTRRNYESAAKRHLALAEC